MALFITLEGVEGCGKTTQSGLLADWLKCRGYRVTLTREPGGCPISDRIRSILLHPENSAITADTELFLYAAARSQHVAEVIRPALLADEIVICDRFTDATLAYQGFARGLDLEQIEQLNRMASGNLQPDLTLLLDFPIDQGLSRARQRNQNTTSVDEGRYEAESTAFHLRVRNGYLRLAESNPRMVVVDATGDIPEIQQQIRTIVDDFSRQRQQL